MLTAGFSLVAIASAVIATDAAAGRSLAARMLRAKPLVAVGVVSYGLYLWHFPIIHLLEPRLSAHRPHALAVLVVVILFTAAALLSYVLVERPALALKRRPFERRGRPSRQQAQWRSRRSDELREPRHRTRPGKRGGALPPIL